MGTVQNAGKRNRATGRKSSGTHEKDVERWYPYYFSQGWYRNTFLIPRLRQSGTSTEAHLPIGCRWDKEYEEHHWNTVEDCGCNFVCLAMIIGVDPAYLASALSAKDFFQADGKFGNLPWDGNRPEVGQPIKLRNLWLPELRQSCNVTLSRVSVGKRRISSAASAERGRSNIKRGTEEGLHAVCGAIGHSALVAGRATADYFLFDPDLEAGRSPRKMWVGRHLFGDMCGNAIEEKTRVGFFFYELKINGVRVRPNSRACDLERVKSRAAK